MVLGGGGGGHGDASSEDAMKLVAMGDTGAQAVLTGGSDVKVRTRVLCGQSDVAEGKAPVEETQLTPNHLLLPLPASLPTSWAMMGSGAS